MHEEVNDTQKIEISLEQLKGNMKNRILWGLGSIESKKFVPENIDHLIDRFKLTGDKYDTIADIVIKQNDTTVYAIVSQVIDELVEEERIRFGKHHRGAPYDDPHFMDELSGKEIKLRKVGSAPA